MEAMAALCAEQGYVTTTLSQVAARSGIAEAELKQMFPTVEACGTAAVNSILAEMMATVSSDYSADIGERDSVLLTIRAILELLASRPDFAALSFICARQMAPRTMRDGLEAGARTLSAMLERLAEDGGTSAPPGAARASLGGAEAVVRREIVAGRTEELPRLLPDLIYAASIPSLGQDEALRLARRGRELLVGTRWG